MGALRMQGHACREPWLIDTDVEAARVFAGSLAGART
jgi:hypothetical protein